MRTKVKFSNYFHMTSVVLVAHDGYLSRRQILRARRMLCGSPECACGGELGERGAQEYEIVDYYLDGGVKVTKSEVAK